MIRWLRNHLLMTCLALVVVVSVGWSIPMLMIIDRSSRAAMDASQAVRIAGESDRCVKSIVDTLVVRSDEVGKALRERDDALHAVFFVALNDRAEAERLYQVYLEKSRQYKATLDAHPLPEAPKLACPN